MKKHIGLVVALMAIFIGKSAAAVEGWQRLNLPESQEYLLFHETKKNEEFIGHNLTTITLLIDVSHVIDYRSIVHILSTYQDRDNVIEVKFKKEQTFAHELQLELAFIIDGLREIFRALAETREFLVEGDSVVLREIAEDDYYSSGEESEGKNPSVEDDDFGWEEVW